MKYLAFCFALLLLVATARAEVATLPASPATGAGDATPHWAAAIDKFGKDSPDAALDAADAKLFADHLLEAGRTAKSAAARAALAPSLRASAPVADASAPLTPKAAATAATADAASHDGKGDDDDWASTVRQSIKDIVRPYQELLPSTDAAAKAARDRSIESGERRAEVANRQSYGVKTELQREREKISSDMALDQLLQELKPWALGAGLILFLGVIVSQWLAYLQRKSTGSSSRQTAPKKRRRSTL